MKILVDQMPKNPSECLASRFGLAADTDMHFCSINERACSIGDGCFECPYFGQIGVMVRFEPATVIDCTEASD